MIRIPLALALLAILAGPAWACPMCKDAGEGADQPGGNQPGLGFFWSIVAMLSTLGLVATSLIRFMIKASRGVSDLPPRPSMVQGAEEPSGPA